MRELVGHAKLCYRQTHRRTQPFIVKDGFQLFQPTFGYKYRNEDPCILYFRSQFNKDQGLVPINGKYRFWTLDFETFEAFVHFCHLREQHSTVARTAQPAHTLLSPK